MVLITTERLTIKSYEYGEEKEVLNLILNNKSHLKLVLSDWVFDIDDCPKAYMFIKRMKAGELLGNIYALGIWLKEGGHLIGEIVFFNVDWDSGKMEIGSYIDRNYQGKGLITEAKRAGLNYFFDRFKLLKVEAVCNINNLASQRVIEKCGFQRTTSLNKTEVQFYITPELLRTNI